MDVYEKALRDAEKRHPSNRGRRNRILAIVIATTVLLGGAGTATAFWLFSQHTPNPSPSNEATDSLLQTGIDQANSGKTDEAVNTFTNVLALDPSNVLANYDLGVIAQARSQTQDALSYYSAALKANPNFTPAMYNKAIIIEATDPDAAMALYQQIVQINPKAATSFYRLGKLYEKAGDAAKAKEAIATAIALDPTLATS